MFLSKPTLFPSPENWTCLCHLWHFSCLLLCALMWKRWRAELWNKVKYFTYNNKVNHNKRHQNKVSCLYIALQCSKTVCNAVLNATGQNCILQFSNTVQYDALQCSTVYYTVLQRITLQPMFSNSWAAKPGRGQTKTLVFYCSQAVNKSALLSVSP